MRPADLTFRGQNDLPLWLATLRRELRSGGEEAPSHILTALSALDEVVATASSLIEGRGNISRADRHSLREDVELALNRLGPRTLRSAQPLLRAFKSSELGRLEALL